MDNVPSMSKQARKARQEAWESGQRTGKKAWEGFQQANVLGDISAEEQVEYLRGIGQFFIGLAHDLAQQQQKENT